MAQSEKNPPAMQETRILSLGGEDLLEKEMSTHSTVLAWKIPWGEEPGMLHTVHGVAESDLTATEQACNQAYLFVFKLLILCRSIAD